MTTIGKANKKPISIFFNTVSLTGSSVNTGLSIDRGPLFDDGALYSAIVMNNLNMSVDHIGLSLNLKLDNIPQVIEGPIHCQYGPGNRASQGRSVLASIVLAETSGQGTSVRISDILLQSRS